VVHVCVCANVFYLLLCLCKVAFVYRCVRLRRRQRQVECGKKRRVLKCAGRNPALCLPALLVETILLLHGVNWRPCHVDLC